MSEEHQKPKPLLQELDEAAKNGATAKELHALRRARIPSLPAKPTDQDQAIYAAIIGAQKAS